MKSANPISKTANIITQELKDEVLIYDLSTDRVVCLNKTSAEVWNACDGSKSVTEITRKLKNDYHPEMTEDVVWLSLSLLESANLLESIPANKFAGISRRSAVKSIGLATTVVLPVINLLVAPVSSQAQSLGNSTCNCNAPAGDYSRPGDCSCSTGSDCCSSACVNGVCISGLSVQSAQCCPSSITCTCASPVGQYLRPGGCACTTGSDCCSSACVNSVCISGTSVQSGACCP